MYDTQHDLVCQNILQRFIAESEEYNFIIEKLIHWSYKKQQQNNNICGCLKLNLIITCIIWNENILL